MTALAPRPGRRPSETATGLVDAAVAGDERAWEVICAEHLARVRAVAVARLRDQHAADDVVQETFLRAWTRLHQVEDARRLGAWLQAIAANVAIDHVRRRRRDTAPLEVLAQTPARGRSHDEHVVALEEAAVLHARLDELREVDRRALWQRDGHGVPVGELADELGMTAGSVRVLLHRARKRVRDGYGLVTVPQAGLLTRLRGRSAGLGEALPVAVAAPVLVIAIAVGVTTPATTPSGPGGQVTAAVPSRPGGSAAAPLPSPTADVVREPVTTESQEQAVTSSPATSTAPEPAPSRPPRVDLGTESAGFTDDAPTDDDADVESGAAVGPVEGLELYLEETGIGELGRDCLVCG